MHNKVDGMLGCHTSPPNSPADKFDCMATNISRKSTRENSPQQDPLVDADDDKCH